MCDKMGSGCEVLHRKPGRSWFDQSGFAGGDGDWACLSPPFSSPSGTTSTTSWSLHDARKQHFDRGVLEFSDSFLDTVRRIESFVHDKALPPDRHFRHQHGRVSRAPRRTLSRRGPGHKRRRTILLARRAPASRGRLNRRLRSPVSLLLRAAHGNGRHSRQSE